MTTQHCDHWIEITDRVAVGEPLSEEERAFVLDHARSCRACGAEASFWDDLGACSSVAEELPLVERAPRVEAILARGAVPVPIARHRRWRRVAAVAAAAAVLVAIALFARPGARAPETATTGAWIAAGGAPRCLDPGPARGDGARVCLAPGSRARTFVEGPAREGYELDRGTIAVSLRPRRSGPVFAVRTAAGDVEAVGTIFSVEVPRGRRGGAVAVLLEGRLRVREPGAEARTLEAGQALTLGGGGPRGLDPAEREALRGLLGQTALAALARDVAGPTTAAPATAAAERDAPPAPGDRRAPVAGRSEEGQTPEPPPGELLRQARQLRVERRHREAAERYGELQRRYPASAEARASLVSLGQLQLQHLGAPAAALRAFDAYLDGGGGGLNLEREALAGRIGALRALGRDAEERAAIETLLRRFPESVEATALRARLLALEAPPGGR